MSQTSLAAPPSEISLVNAHGLGRSRRLIAAVLILALAHLPLLALYARSLWVREHYQFFPLLLPGAAILAYRRLAGHGPLPVGSRPASYALFAGAWTVLALAILLPSPWLGAVAGQLVLLAVMYSLGGRKLVRCLLPSWLLLWLSVRLPYQLDDQVVGGLQQLASAGASRVLDVLGVLHARHGSVLDVGGRHILLGEACSGVHSLFSVLACTFFWLAWKGRSVRHGILLLAAAVGWVLIGNVGRVVVVATLDGYQGVNLGEGWAHAALGFGVFGLLLVLVWSTDHLLLLLAPLAGLPRLRGRGGYRLEPAEAHGHTRLPALAATALTTWPVLAGYGLLAVCSLRCQLLGDENAPAVTILAPAALPAPMVGALGALDERTLPERYGPWQRERFEVREGAAETWMSQYNRTWHYRAGRMSAVLGIHYPFLGWKDVPNCYERQGWTVQEHHVQDADGVGPYVIARLRAPEDEGYAYLIFQMRDGANHPLPSPGQDLGPDLRARLQALGPWKALTGGTADSLPETPTYQVQLLVRSPQFLGAAEEEDARALFEQFLQVLPRGPER